MYDQLESPYVVYTSNALVHQQMYMSRLGVMKTDVGANKLNIINYELFSNMYRSYKSALVYVWFMYLNYL